jgi:LysR family glycine cleavage system transcriptional activator
VFESLHLALSAAAAGQGVALGLTPLTDEDLKSGALVRPFDVELSSPYAFWFVCRKDRLRERKIRAFRNWIFEVLARDGDRTR